MKINGLQTPKNCRARRCVELSSHRQRKGKGSRPISRVLSRTIIPLGYTSPCTSSDLPGSCVGHALQLALRASLFDLAPSGVYRAVECCHRRGALLPHPFTLTGFTRVMLRRFTFCCTFRGLAPPRRYLALCPMEPGLSSTYCYTAIVWPTPARIVERIELRCKPMFKAQDPLACKRMYSP